jgi:hypothetical protein
MPTRIQIGETTHRATSDLPEVEAQVRAALTEGTVASIPLVNGGSLVINASLAIALSDPNA